MSAPGASHDFLSGGALVPGNRVELLSGAQEFIARLVAAIDQARTEIHLETYIFQADASGARVRDALMRAAQRGVVVRVLVDGVGSRALPRAWLDALRGAGVAVLVYRPPHLGWLTNPLNLRRLHRKVAVIDAALAIVGGMNIIDDFPLERPRLDYSVAVRGPLLARIHHDVRRLWRLVALSQLRLTRVAMPRVAPSWPIDGRVRAAFLVRDNFRHRRDIEHAYHAALTHASDEVIIANAYFLPGRGFREALKNTAARGVRVRLLVQGRTDHPFFQAAARALYGDLCGAGVEIHEYHASELHAKVAVVDGAWVTVGSSNIDPFSLLLAREANVVVEDRGLAGGLVRDLQAAMQPPVSRRVDADWPLRPRWRRAGPWLAYALVRLMVGLAGFARWT